MDAVLVPPSTGSVWIDACSSVFCVAPPYGMSTVERPTVESNCSIMPSWEPAVAARSDSSTLAGACFTTPPSAATISTFWARSAPLVSMNSRERSKTTSSPMNMRSRPVSVMSASATASMFSSAAAAMMKSASSGRTTSAMRSWDSEIAISRAFRPAYFSGTRSR